MKKILSILAAVTVFLSCYSCNDNNKKDTNEEKEKNTVVSQDSSLDTGVVDEDENEDEDEFREYGADYFKVINLNTSISDSEPPVKEHILNITPDYFGSRLSPCRDEKYIGRYNYLDEGNYNEEDRNRLEGMWEKSKTEPSPGYVCDIAMDGKYIYAVVNYDIMCTGWHDFSIFRINTENNEKEEIFRHSDPETNCMIISVYCMNGVVYLISPDKGICYLDEEKKELVTIKEITGDIYPTFRPNSAGRLIIEGCKEERELVPEDYEPGPNESLFSYNDKETYLITSIEKTIEEYDLDDKTWKTLYNTSTDFEAGTPEYPEISGKYFAWKEKPEGSRKYDIVTDKYRVSTGLTGCYIAYADDDKVIAIQNSLDGSGGSERMMHYFDLKKAEHYIINASKYGTQFSALGDGFIVSSTEPGKNMYYLLPDLGIFFRLYDIEDTADKDDEYSSEACIWSEDKAVFCVMKETDPHEAEFGGKKFTDYDYESEIHWFTQER